MIIFYTTLSGIFQKNHIKILSILSLIGSLMIFVATFKYGLGVSPDSVGYLSAAQDLASGNGINLTISPPLYPAMLAIISKVFGLPPLISARILNIGGYGLVIFLSGLIYFKYFKTSLTIYLIGICLVVFSLPLIKVFLMAWTEPLFILLILLYFIFFEKYQINSTKVNLCLFSLTVAMACLTRYIGVVLILTGIISILSLKNKTYKTKVFELAVFIFISSFPIVIWMIRNYLISGTLTGPRALSTYSILDNVKSMMSSFLNWYFPGTLQNLYIFGVIFLMIGFVTGIYYKEIRVKEGKIIPLKSHYIVVIAVYLIFLVASSKTSFLQRIDSRYLSPIYIPLNLLLLLTIRELIKPLVVNFGQKIYFVITIIFILVWTAFSGRIIGYKLVDHLNNGSGYTSKPWKNSETLSYFDNNLNDCTVYSNGSDVIRFLTGKNVQSAPLKRNGALIVDTTFTLKSKWPLENEVCVVWFDLFTWRDYYFTPGELISISKLTHEIRLSDGAVYIFSK